MLVDIDYVANVVKFLQRTNSQDLSELKFIDADGEYINVPSEIINEWKETGLSNMQFIQIKLLNK